MLERTSAFSQGAFYRIVRYIRKVLLTTIVLGNFVLWNGEPTLVRVRTKQVRI